MNPYNNYPYPQQIPQIPQHIEPKILSYTVDSVEQLATLPPMPNTIYLGIARDGSKIFQRRMNNDGLMEIKTFSLATIIWSTRSTPCKEHNKYIFFVVTSSAALGIEFPLG